MPATVGLTELARAKVNLTLRVLGRRTDGFHELDSIVVFADIGDHVTLMPGGPATVSTTGPFAPAIHGDNLAATTLALLNAKAPQLRLGAIAIEKLLPVAAGLGGGSADAAAVLRLVRRANSDAASGFDWHALAADLGSDVPVCLASRAHHMTGRGLELSVIAAMPALSAVLVNPRVPVPADKTRQVFKRLAAPALSGPPRPQQTLPQSRADWLDHLARSHNDLEPPATSVIPAIADVLAALRGDPRILLARLSGAGPTCFAITESMHHATALAADLQQRHPAWWVRATQLG